MNAIEVEGNTLQEALEKGMNELKATRDEIEYELLQTATTGFLGFGKKLAKVRIKLKEEKADEEVANVSEKAVDSNDSERESYESDGNKRYNGGYSNNYNNNYNNGYNNNYGNGYNNNNGNNYSNGYNEGYRDRSERFENRDYNGYRTADNYSYEKEEERVWEPNYGPFEASEDDTAAVERGEALLYKICEYMKLDVKLTKETGEYGFIIHIDGDDLGILIGKHGQTLDALQYLANIAANKTREFERVRILLDVEDYRARRDETLRRLAMRLSKKAVIENREIRLEPMTRHERKVIHTVLQNNHRISTYSDGEEPYRSIVIVPRRRFDRYDRI
ncbi:MAG: KH domain-containing protein [Selenomonadaceae bacterium]|nr:KH domain-containing protein [Selenomonadaceae bacterium]